MTTPPASAPSAARCGAALMSGSLILVLVVNALARHLASHYPIGEIVFFRFVGALPVVLTIAASAGPGALRPRHLGLHALRAILTLAAMSALYAASRHLPFSDLIALSYAAPLFVAALSGALLGERLGGPRLALIAAGFAGVLLVACPGRLEIWSLGALAMAAGNALATICTAQLGRTSGAPAIALYFTLFGCLFSLPALAFGWETPAVGDLALFAMLGLAAGLAIKLHAAAFRAAPAFLLAQIDYGAVALSIPLGFALWSETPSLPMIAGGVLIVGAGLLQLKAAGGTDRRLRRFPPPIGEAFVETASR